MRVSLCQRVGPPMLRFLSRDGASTSYTVQYNYIEAFFRIFHLISTLWIYSTSNRTVALKKMLPKSVVYRDKYSPEVILKRAI